MLNSARENGETQDQFHLSSALRKEQQFLGGQGTDGHSRQWEDSMSSYMVFRPRVVLGDRSVNRGMGVDRSNPFHLQSFKFMQYLHTLYVT